jgi:outer membrane protein assembly factor BamE (lipoprotein component of BamABCDE complex)
MNSLTLKSFAAVGVALALGACASTGAGHVHATSYELAAIHAGLTKDQVRAIAGEPSTYSSNPRNSESLWTYTYTDEWGYPSEFGVDFDKTTGLVTETSSQRIGND